MSIFSLPKEVKAKVLSEVKKINRYDLRILYLLKNLGSQRFTDLIEYAGLSRSTVSKYLKNHEKKNIIEKKLFKNQITNRQEQRYFITELGIEILNEEHIDTSESFYFNELNSYISQLSDLVNFYKEIGVADSIIYQILKMISKVGENFFILEKDKDFYLTLFYIFLNSVSTRDFKFEINEFCKHYDVKRLRIDFYVDKIMSNNLGYYIFTRGDDIFFFHADDIIGTTTLRLIKDRLIKEILHINLDGYRKIYDLDKMAEKIAENLLKMNLIWEADEDAKIGGIREPFEMLIEKMLIKTALDMGFSRPFLMDMILQSEKMRKSKRGVNTLIDIIEGSERYEDLNLVSISEFKSLDMDEILEQIQGFCPNCGKTILKKDLSTVCSKCSKELEETELIRDIDEVNKVSMRFKQIKLKEEEIIECPNPNCNYYVKSSWNVCPECSTPIRKE